MILNKNYIIGTLSLAVALAFSGCAGSYKAVPNMAKLDAKLSDSKWNGKVIPKEEVCTIHNGKGSTPQIMISSIPQGANAIIMEINDEGNLNLSSDGGHGKVGFWIKKGTSFVTLTSIPGETDKNLPNGTFIEESSKAGGKYATSGYLPPCSGGKNHMYSAKIKAVYKAKNDEETSRLLGETYIQFGRY